MKSIYQRFFGLKVFHEYYTDQLSRDFEFRPTRVCERIIRGHRLMFFRTQQGFHMAYPTQNGTPLIPIHRSPHFSFTMRLKNTDLFNFTAIPQRAGFVHYFSNKEIGDLKKSSIHDGLTPPDSKQLYHYYADKNDIAGKYLEKEQLAYDRNAFGYVSIYQEALKNGRHAIAFQTRSKVWRYCVILPGAGDRSEYAIQKGEDLKKGNGNRYASLSVSFEKKEQKPWNEGRQMLLFESVETDKAGQVQGQMSVPYYEEGFKNLQLIKRNNDKGTSVDVNTLINHLPSPSVKSLNPEIFIYL